MPPGHVAALSGSPARRAVLETDEVYLPRVLTATAAATASVAEPVTRPARPDERGPHDCRELAGGTGGRAPYARRGERRRSPGGVGGRRGAPRALGGGRVALAARRRGLPLLRGPHCLHGRRLVLRDLCLRHAPSPEATLVVAADGSAHATWADGRTAPVRLALPGRFNQSNALMAAVAAEACGVDALVALGAMAEVQEVAGRFAVRSFGDVRARLMLAKNPAGWDELLDLVAGSDAPLVVSINARIADGADPSWLWDVPLRAPRRTRRGRHRGPLPRPVGAPPLRRRAPQHRSRSRCAPCPRPPTDPVRWSTSSGTTPPSTTCWARRDERPRCASPSCTRTCWARTATAGTAWCWRGGPNGAGSTPCCSRPPPTVRSPRPTSTAWAGARTAPRSAPPRRSWTTAPWYDAWPTAPSCWRCAQASRSSGGPSPGPPETSTRASASWRSTR